MQADLSQFLDGSFSTVYDEVNALRVQVKTLSDLVGMQSELLRNYKAQLDQLPAEAGSGYKASKVPDPPFFSGSDDKTALEDWLNQIAPSGMELAPGGP